VALIEPFHVFTTSAASPFRYWRSITIACTTLALLLSLSQLIGCTVAPEAPGRPAAHPLLGQIWDVQRGATISREALLRELSAAQFILLGEVHDNPEHHRLQAEVLRALIALGRRPALAMEQFDREFQPALDAAPARSGASADTVADAGRFDRKGWPWPLYEPLVSIAVEARLPIVALNLSLNRAREVARQGFGSLGASAATELALDRSWNPSRQAIQAREIDDGHCGKLPPSALPRMIDVQRARDATMADALVGISDAGAVVIAGGGHVRIDVGIPLYLASRAPGKRSVSVGFIEVDPDRPAVTDYARMPATALPFDYAWFTTAAEREDPCAGLVMPNRP
jgi:uncharacterized iron-regulated protein